MNWHIIEAPTFYNSYNSQEGYFTLTLTGSPSGLHTLTGRDYSMATNEGFYFMTTFHNKEAADEWINSILLPTFRELAATSPEPRPEPFVRWDTDNTAIYSDEDGDILFKLVDLTVFGGQSAYWVSGTDKKHSNFTVGQMVPSSDAAHLWAESFARKMRP